MPPRSFILFLLWVLHLADSLSRGTSLVCTSADFAASAAARLTRERSEPPAKSTTKWKNTESNASLLPKQTLLITSMQIYLPNSFYNLANLSLGGPRLATAAYTPKQTDTTTPATSPCSGAKCACNSGPICALACGKRLACFHLERIRAPNDPPSLSPSPFSFSLGPDLPNFPGPRQMKYVTSHPLSLFGSHFARLCFGFPRFLSAI